MLEKAVSILLLSTEFSRTTVSVVGLAGGAVVEDPAPPALPVVSVGLLLVLVSGAAVLEAPLTGIAGGMVLAGDAGDAVLKEDNVDDVADGELEAAEGTTTTVVPADKDDARALSVGAGAFGSVEYATASVSGTVEADAPESVGFRLLAAAAEIELSTEEAPLFTALSNP